MVISDSKKIIYNNNQFKIEIVNLSKKIINQRIICYYRNEDEWVSYDKIDNFPEKEEENSLCTIKKLILINDDSLLIHIEYDKDYERNKIIVYHKPPQESFDNNFVKWIPMFSIYPPYEVKNKSSNFGSSIELSEDNNILFISDDKVWLSNDSLLKNFETNLGIQGCVNVYVFEDDENEFIFKQTIKPEITKEDILYLDNKTINNNVIWKNKNEIEGDYEYGCRLRVIKEKNLLKVYSKEGLPCYNYQFTNEGVMKFINKER